MADFCAEIKKSRKTFLTSVRFGWKIIMEVLGMYQELIEIAVNLAEAILLFLLLKHKLTLRKKTVPLAIICIIVLAAATTIMNKAELSYVFTTIINLTLYCAYAVLFFADDIRLRLVWASMMIYITVFANTFLIAIMYSISSSVLIAGLNPTAIRIAIQAVYLLLCSLMTATVLKTTKKLVSVTSKAAVGIMISCMICITAMYLLLEVTIESASAGVDSLKFCAISALLMALVLLLLLLFAKANVWAQKYSEERIVSESLEREIRYNSEMTVISGSIRQLKHDYSNHMSVIALLTEDGDIESLRKYMSDYKAEYGNIDRYAITGDNSLDILFSYKKMICDAEGIELKITSVCEGIHKTGLSATELSSLFGNLLDNAINACRKLDREKRKISLSIRDKAQMLNIRIENNCIDLPEKPEESKHIGLGLPRIKSIVDAHNGICTVSPESERFIVDILFPKISAKES